MFEDSRATKLIAFAVAALLLTTGAYSYAVVFDTELGIAGFSAGNTGTEAGNTKTNPVGVCAGNAGNTGCSMDGSTASFGVLRSKFLMAADRRILGITNV